MQNKLFAAIMTALLVLLMAGSAMCATTYDSSVILENKVGHPDWDIINDGFSALIEYNAAGDEFEWRATGVASINNIDYVLIYYADKENRYDNWGGNNPGAYIGTITTGSDGSFDVSDSTELNMNMPSTPDTNMDVYDYSSAPDNYTNAHGAKLWMVPAAQYNIANSELTSWTNVNHFLFETDLIWYDDCDEFYEGEPDIATFSIGDAFGVTTIPITITNATNVGAVYVTLEYNALLVTVTEVLNGDMESTFSNIGTGQVTIGTAQTNNPGLNGDFTLAYLNVTPVGTETYNITISVTTYRDATPCGRTMPYIITPGDGSPYLNGDVNGDGMVDMFDVMYLAKHVLCISGFEDIIELASDVDGDGDIDMADVTYLAMHIVGASGWEVLK